jgi:hypothetical protein
LFLIFNPFFISEKSKKHSCGVVLRALDDRVLCHAGVRILGLLLDEIVYRSAWLYLSPPSRLPSKALLLTTAGFAGFNDILKYLDSVARIWGFDVAARVEIRFHATFGTLPPYVVKENEKK